jgi:hypothetical protein
MNPTDEFKRQLRAMGLDPARADRYIVDDSQLTIAPRAATGSHVRHLGSQRWPGPIKDSLP